MTVLPLSQNKRRALYRNLMIGIIGLLGALTIASRVFGFDVHAIVLLLLFPIVVLAPLQFFALDEAARQGHFAAWYWGCFLGMFALGAIAIGLNQGFVPFEPIATAAAHWVGGPDQASMFVAGLIVGPVLMVAGYLICASLHWLRMR